MISIVDYGMGNILSVKNALEMLTSDVKICTGPDDLKECDRIVLPGVGAYGDCAANLRQLGFAEALNDAVKKRGIPILGICLGMQIMAQTGHEGGRYEGLGWFDAEVVRITPQSAATRIPHIGWNNLHYDDKCFLFKGLPNGVDVYFVHSYYMKCANDKDIVASFEYDGKFTAAVMKENIMATQFHPEKSQDYGQTMLYNFINWKP